MKILIADDDKILRLGLKSKIEKNTRHEVVGQACNGEEALAALKEKETDLLITDIKMPGMNGVELVKKLKELDMRVKVIVLSGYDEYKFVRDTLKSGAVDYLLKPVENSVLFDLLDKINAKIESENKSAQQLRLLQERVSEGLNVLKERFLSDLVDGRFSDAETGMRKLEEMGMPAGSLFTMAIIGLDDFYSVKKEIINNSYAVKLDPVKEKIISLFSGLESSFDMLLTNKNMDIVVMFINKGNEAEKMIKDVHIALEEIFKGVYKDFGFSATAGVSCVYDTLDRACAAYHQALFAYNRKFYDGKGRIHDYAEEKCRYEYFLNSNLMDYVSLLLDFINAGLTNKVKKTMHDTLGWLYTQNIDPVQFKEAVVWMVTKLINLSEEFGTAVECYKDESGDLTYYIKEMGTYEELLDYIEGAFTVIAQNINDAKLERSKKIIDISKDYINKHYHENISLKTVAEKVHLNPNYFSELFRNEVGKNFLDYVTEIRINKAKKLLMDPETKAYEVGQKVGYCEPVTFNRAFKRVEGISPNEYRKIILGK